MSREMAAGIARVVWPPLAAVTPLGASDLSAGRMLDVEPLATQQLWHRRALLQTPNNRRAFGSINHLIIFTGVLTGLAFGIILIFCLCVHLRLRRGGGGGHSPAGRRRHEAGPRQIVLRQAKTLQLPVLVIGPGNEVSYAHKLDPEAELAAAAAASNTAKQCSSGGEDWATGGSPGADAVGQPVAPAVVEMTVVDVDRPSDEHASAVPAPPSAAQGMAAAGAHPAVADALATAAAAGPGAAARIGQRLRQWHSRQSQAEREAQAALQRQQLAWRQSSEDEQQPEVRIIPAFIEWDVSSSEGPIVHPPPLLQPQLTRPSRAAELARAEALLLARANSSSGRRGSAFWRTGSRAAEAVPPLINNDARRGGIGTSASSSGSMAEPGSTREAGSGGSGPPELRARSVGFGQVWRHGITWRPSLHATSAPPQ